MFLSYSRSDQKRAMEISDALEEKGVQILFDEDDISPGEAWKTRLLDLIVDCDKVIFILSQSSATSDVCEWEIKESIRFGKYIVPIRIDGVEVDALPEDMRDINIIDLRPGESFSSISGKVSEVISKNIFWEREKRRIGGLARKWLENGSSRHLLLSHNDEIRAAEGWRDNQPIGSQPPSALQHEYINASRRRATNRLRKIIYASATASVLLLVAAITAFFQRSVAIEAGQESRNRLSEALVALSESRLLEGDAVSAAQLALMSWPAGPGMDGIRDQQSVSVLSKALFALRKQPVAIGRRSSITDVKFIHRERLIPAVVSDGVWLSGTDITSWMGDTKSKRFAISDDGLRYAAIDDTGTVIIYGTEANTKEVEFNIDNRYFDLRESHIYFMNHSRSLLVQGDNYFEIWDPKDGSYERRHQIYTEDRINDIQISIDNNAIVTAHGDSTNYVRRNRFGIKIWYTTHGNLGDEHMSLSHPAFSVALSDDGHRTAVGLETGKIHIFSTYRGSAVEELDGHVGMVTSLAFSKDGSVLFSGSSDGSTRVWDLATKKITGILSGQRQVDEIAVSDDRRHVLTGAYGLAGIWNLSGVEQHVEFAERWFPVELVAYSAQTDLAAIGSSLSLGLWDLDEGEVKIKLKFRDKEVGAQLMDLQFSPDGKRVAAATLDGEIAIWRTDLDRPREILVGLVGADLSPSVVHKVARRVNALRFRHDTDEIVAATDAGVISIDASSGRLIQSFDAVAGTATQIEISSNGDFFVVGQEKGALIVDTGTGQIVHQIDGLRREVTGLSVSQDSELIAVGSYFGEVLIFSVSEGKVLWSKNFFPRSIQDLAFSPNGRRLAVSHRQGASNSFGTIEILDVATGGAVERIDAKGKTRLSLEFVRDGKFLLSTSGNRGVNLWRTTSMSDENLFETICGLISDQEMTTEVKNYEQRG